MPKPRICSGAIPYRYNEDGKFEVLMVKSTSGEYWVFPKGGVEANLSKRKNAIKEVAEEGGVVGGLGSKLGVFNYTRGETVQEVHMYSMHVVLELESYPESRTRERRWMTAEEAMAACIRPEVRNMVLLLSSVFPTLTDGVYDEPESDAEPTTT